MLSELQGSDWLYPPFSKVQASKSFGLSPACRFPKASYDLKPEKAPLSCDYFQGHRVSAAFD